MHILYLFIAFTAGLLVVPFWKLFVQGRVVNWWYTCAVVVGALADVGCQAWIDLSKLFRRRKSVQLDDTENFY
jgi:hypothetical protein